jgi:hypothetical protein
VKTFGGNATKPLAQIGAACMKRQTAKLDINSKEVRRCLMAEFNITKE